VDISDYVVGAGQVPYISRNPDLTLRLETWNLEIAGSIAVLLSGGHDISKGQLIKVEKDSVFLFGGEIIESNYNYDTQIYSLEISNRLEKLKENMLDYATLGATFFSGSASQYWTDWLGFSSVQCLWAIQCAFSVNSLTLNLNTGLATTNLFTRTIDTNWAGRTITYGDLYFDEEQLYCLGTESVVKHTTNRTGRSIRQGSPRLGDGRGGGYERIGVSLYSTTKNDTKAEVDCAEFVSECLTSLGLAIQQTAIDTFTLYALTDNYTITDDDKYSFESNGYDAKLQDVGYSFVSGGIGGNWLSSASYRNGYYSTSETKLSEVALGGADKITPMQNFAVLFADTNSFIAEYGEAGADIDLSSSFVLNDNSVLGRINLIAYRYRAYATPKTVEKVTMPATSTYKSVVENFIDLENRTSQIVQETY